MDYRQPQFIRKLAIAYMSAKQIVIEEGFAGEIDWQDENKFEYISEQDFIREAAWVILSSGMRESVIRKKFPSFSESFNGWKSATDIMNNKISYKKAAILHFNNEKKIEAIFEIANSINLIGYENVKKSINDDGIDLIMKWSYMGPATAYHFAKNIGIDVVKPDRHLLRIAKITGYNSPHKLCTDISKIINEKISVIDVVMWRYATLNKEYLNLFSLKT